MLHYSHKCGVAWMSLRPLGRLMMMMVDVMMMM